MDCEERNIYKRALGYWGSALQTEMMVEECAELIHAIQARKRYRCDDSAVVEEIADVSLMLEQMKYVYGHEAVDAAIARKVERLEGRLAVHDAKDAEAARRR